MIRHLFNLKTNNPQATQCGVQPDANNLVRMCRTNVSCPDCLRGL